MLVNNYYKCIAELNGFNNSVVNTPIVTINGNNEDIYFDRWEEIGKAVGFFYLRNIADSSQNYPLGIAFGKSGEQPTINDFNLNDPIFLNEIDVAVSGVNDVRSNNIIYTYSITNKTDTDITIKEYVLYNQTRGGVNALKVFITLHSLLEEPVTIAPGEAGTVIVHIKVGV